MDKSKVALVRCNSYDEDEVYTAIETGVNLLGGFSQFVKPGEKIVLKPNVLLGAHPDKSITTHPSVLKSTAKLLKTIDVNVFYGDSPSIGKSESQLRRCGLKEPADELNLTLAEFDQGRVVEHKEALLNKSFIIANGVLDTDGLISLPKLKTHGLTRLTGAVKNQFGCIPGYYKGQFHVKMPDPRNFGIMLVDLNTLIRPRFYIMDAIIAMEGNGPRSGTPKKLGAILFSSDPIALDSIACKIIDLNPEFVPTSQPGEEAGLGTYHYENIDVVGEDVEQFVDKDFEVVRKATISMGSNPIRRFLKNRICPRPGIDKALCVNCGTCVTMCPVEPKAIDWHSGDNSKIPNYKYGRCIRCYCCQEVCPEGAISMENPLIGRILFPMS